MLETGPEPGKKWHSRHHIPTGQSGHHVESWLESVRLECRTMAYAQRITIREAEHTAALRRWWLGNVGIR